MNINQLIEFIYLAETLSFKRTADYFYVSRSVISRHLASLEEVIGVKLVDRGNQSVQLTEAGKVFYREAQSVLRAYATAIDRTREAGSMNSRIVRIGYLKNAARPVIVRFVRFMNHEHPEIHLDITCMEHGELRRALEDGSVDIAIGMNIDPRLSRNYRSTLLYTDHFFAIMSKDHPLSTRVDGVPFCELLNEKLLLPDSFSYAGLGELIDELLDSSKTKGTTRAYYEDVDTLFLKVQAEGYVAFSSGLNNVMFGDGLAIVAITGIDSSFSVSAFYGEDLPETSYQACCRAFESCHASMKSWDSSSESAIGFSLASFS